MEKFNRDDLILKKAKEIHRILFSLYEDLNGDSSAGIAVLELAKTMFNHFGSPDGDNKGRTSASMEKVKSTLILPEYIVKR